jgi:predicted ATPase
MHREAEEQPQNRSLLWRVWLMDGPVLQNADGEQTHRFRSQKVGALLAYLALKLGRPCPREELAYAIWTDEDDPQVVANRLRVALASLRRQLEPAGVPFGSVLDVSEPGRIRLRAETVWCDVAAFEQAYKAGRHAEAARLLNGTLLPGYYDDWAVLERERLETLSFIEEEKRRRGEKETERTTENTGAIQNPNALITQRSHDQTSPLLPFSSSPLLPLPLYLTRYFGREKEKEQLHELICQYRLVTLTGHGGMGKTRLAVETARTFPLPCVFVPLADVAQSEQIPEAILRALRVTPAPNAELTEQIVALFLRREPLLLLLDNAEHLIEATATLTFRLLEAVPDLTILVTSRQRLNIAGEMILPLDTLPTPEPDTSAEQFRDSPAVALFVDRARNARPDFALSPRHAPAIQQICEMLNGVPLALELAAARVVSQTPTQIAESLQAGLMLLQSSQHGLSKRHRSLRASIQGSFDLLSPELQAFFAALSVFQGGWTAESVHSVTDCPQTEEFLEVLTLRSLLFLQENEATGTLRYSFLESIRQFAAEQLLEPQCTVALARHADYFLSLAASVMEDDFRSLRVLDAEQENLHAALETGWTRQDEPFWRGLVGALNYAYVRGKHSISLAWAERAHSVASAIPNTELSFRVRFACYPPLSYAGKLEQVRALGEQMRSEAQALDDPAGLIYANIILGNLATFAKDWDASLDYAREALETARQINDAELLCRSLRVTAWLMHNAATANPAMDAETRAALSQESDRLSRECLALMPAASTYLTFATLTLSYSLKAQGRKDEAYRYLKQAQQIAVEHGMNAMLIFALVEESRLAIEDELWEYAAWIYGAFRALREKTGYFSAESNPQIEQPLADLLAHFGAKRFEELARQGEKAPLDSLPVFSLHNLPKFDAELPNALTTRCPNIPSRAERINRQ